MAKVVYVDGINGDNSNDGLTLGTAKKTIIGARAATATYDLVLISGGVYLEGKQVFSSANDRYVLYMANPATPSPVIVDFEESSDIYGRGHTGGEEYYWRCYGVRFMNIMFRNAINGAAFCSFVSYPAAFIHCTFYMRSGPANACHGLTSYNSGNNVAYVYNCSFYNLNEANTDFTGPVRNCYYENVTTPFVSMSNADYCAYPGGIGHHTDTNTTNPGFRDVSNEDFRLDPVTTPADYSAFLTSGENGTRIGAFGKGGTYYNPLFEQLRFLSAAPTSAQGNPQLAWEDEGPAINGGTGTYTDGTPGNIIENAVNYELEIDLATTPAATGGRIRSDVIDLGTGIVNLASMAYGSFEDPGNGAAIDTDTTLPRKIEYRTSATSFLKGDVSPTWTEIERGDYLNSSNRYVQFRVEFRTDHTNA